MVHRSACRLLAAVALWGCGDPPLHPAPSKWQDLYGAYFGPAAASSCAGTGSCHAMASQLGAKASGFVCGATQDSCWKGMTVGLSNGQASIVPTGGTSMPESTLLYSALNKGPGGVGLNNMPYQQGFVFKSDDVARITSWIQAGAQDN